MISQTLAHYRITAALGAGGMGEVYRATDTKLGREVALKVLPEAFAADPDRMARFEREAKVLASLNHPNIATLYGLEATPVIPSELGESRDPPKSESDSSTQRAPGNSGGPSTRGAGAPLAQDDGRAVTFLAMELVEGEDLSSRIKREPVPVDDALPIALQIAEALEAAHEQGIVHRDLKPANIKLTDDGVVKVLDFGLAKVWESEGGDVSSSLSPTLTQHATLEGVILGTAAYMSPEQARAKPVDKRADIWAFGVVFFEMLTGRQLFSGETVSDVLAAVLTHEPNLDALPVGTPEAARRMLRRCLERDPRRRMRDIGDARIIIDDLISGRGDFGPQASAADPALTAPLWRRALPWAVGLVGLAAGIAGLLRSAPPGTSTDPAPVSRLMIPLPEDAPLFNQGAPSRALALSPDGALVVYVTDPTSLDTRLRLRRLAEHEIRSIPGTELAKSPFFSPDGKWLAYFDLAEGALKKISIEGGRAVTVARGFANAGWMLGSWCGDGRIVFDTWNGGLRTVGSDGGEPRALTQPTDEWHLDPQPLPGPSCRVLFYTLGRGEPTIEALSLDSGERVTVLENASHGMYLASGHLLFMREQALFVAPFDALRLKVTGPAIALPIDTVVDFLNESTPAPQLAVAGNGTLVYGASDPDARRDTDLVSLTASGQTEELGALPFLFPRMALSPSGDLLAAAGRQGGRPKIEVLDLERRTTTIRFETSGTGPAMQPVWTADGSALLYARNGPFEGEIVRHFLDGHLPDQTLVKVPGTWLCPTSLSADGRYLLVTHYVPETGGEILLVDLQDANGPAVTPLAATAGTQYGGVISPDGRSFAYVSDEAGSWDVLIETFPERGQKTRVFSGGNSPLWSPDGKDLYFMTQGSRPGEVKIMAGRVEHAPALRVGQPRQVFSGSFFPGDDSGQAFAVTADRRFILQRIPAGYSREYGFATELRVVQNWFTELRRETAAAER